MSSTKMTLSRIYNPTTMMLQTISRLRTNGVRVNMAAVLDVLAKYFPTAAKYVALLLVLINVRSFPLMWHFRVFEQFFVYRFEYFGHLFRSRLLFESKQRRKLRVERWFDNKTPVGMNPFDFEGKYTSWASPDESDFNGHLSNSSYAKTLDAARFESALVLFPQLFLFKGWMPLAGTHYTFLREIPMFASFEVRTTIAAWDHKWVYVVCRFVSKPKKGKKGKKQAQQEPKTPPPTYIPSVRTPATTAEIETESSTPLPPSSASSPATPAQITQAIASSISHEEEDAAILHTISVSQMCFKIGRITIPPAIALAINGLTHAKGYSLSNPPPNWTAMKQVRDMKKFLSGGWKEVEEKDRWWEEALGGEVEERRRRNLEILQGGKGMLEGVKDIIYSH